MNYYTYIVTFAESDHYYYGFHRHREGDNYLGSPVTHKQMWEEQSPSLKILAWFDTLDEARFAEVELITPVLNDPLCLNEHNGLHPSYEACVRGGRNSLVGRKALTKKSRSKANKNRKNQLELCSKAGKIGGRKAVETGQLAEARRKSHDGETQAARTSKPIEITFPDGTVSWFRSARDAQLKTGLNRLSLSRAAKKNIRYKDHQVCYSSCSSG